MCKSVDFEMTDRPILALIGIVAFVVAVVGVFQSIDPDIYFQLVEFAYSPLGLFALFVICLCCLHLMAFKWPRIRTDAIFWKRTDYVWLSLGAIGLLGIVEHASKEFYRNPEDQKLNRLDRQRAYVMKHLYETSLQNGTQMFPPPLTPVSVPAHPHWKWHAELHATLSEHPEWGSKELTEHTTDAPESEKTYFLHQVATFTRIESHEPPGANPFLNYWVIISPFLIAFALALRITKVTAESHILKTQLIETE